MPNTRVMLWIALAAILFLNYEAWMRDYPESAAAVAPAIGGGTAASGKLGETVPQANPVGQSGPVAPAPANVGTAVPPSAAPLAAAIPSAATPVAATDAAAPAEPLHVVTDVLDVEINLKGGEVDRADILQYPLHKDTPNIPVRLMDDSSEDSLYLLQTGLAGTPGEAAPTHLATWSSPEKSYVLRAGVDELRVPLTWTDDHGLEVTKTFTFKRGSYAVDLGYEVTNHGSTTRSLAPYSQFLRHWAHASRSYFDVETYSFKGPRYTTGRNLAISKWRTRPTENSRRPPRMGGSHRCSTTSSRPSCPKPANPPNSSCRFRTINIC